MLVAAVALILASQWPRLSHRVPKPKPARRSRRLRRKTKLRVVEPEHDQEFIRAVERDLAALPTIDEHDAKNR
jgi:hypothetical protein